MEWENNIKKTLENRVLEPSDTSWSVLAERLDDQNRKKRKAIYLWMGVAASVLGILFAVSLFFKDTISDVNNPVWVETQQKSDEKVPPTENNVPREHVVENAKKVEKSVVHGNGEVKKQTNNNRDHLLRTRPESLSIADTKNRGTIMESEMNESQKTFEEQKISEILAQINDLKSKGKTVTEDDIDVLLKKAQKEILLQTILKESTSTVDANALLNDVEADLQQSFRNKIFEVFKNSYETVKTAVAERKN